MIEQFLSSLKNRTAWRSWCRAFALACFFSIPVFWSFSLWSLILCGAGLVLAFAVRGAGEKGFSTSLFFAFSAVVLIGIWFLFFQTSFFDFWSFPHFLFFLFIFFVYLLIFPESFSFGSRFSEQAVSLGRAFVLLSFFICSSFVGMHFPLFGYLFLFVGIFFVSRDFFLSKGWAHTLQVRALSLLSALAGVELIFSLSFLPFLPWIASVLGAVFLILLWDILRVGKAGKITKSFILSRCLLFVIFVLVAAAFTRWIPV